MGELKDPASPEALAVLSAPLETIRMEGDDLHGMKWLLHALTPPSTGSKWLRGERHTGGDLLIQGGWEEASTDLMTTLTSWVLQTEMGHTEPP